MAKNQIPKQQENRVKDLIKKLLKKAIVYQSRFSSAPAIDFMKPEEENLRLIDEMKSHLKKDKREELDDRYTTRNLYEIMEDIIQEMIADEFPDIELPGAIKKKKKKKAKEKKRAKKKIQRALRWPHKFIHEILDEHATSRYVNTIFEKIFYPSPIDFCVELPTVFLSDMLPHLDSSNEDRVVISKPIRMELKNEHTLLRISDEGYLTKSFSHTLLAKSFITNLKSLLGLCMGCDILRLLEDHDAAMEKIEEGIDVYFESDMNKRVDYELNMTELYMIVQLVDNIDLYKSAYSIKDGKRISQIEMRLDLVRSIFSMDLDKNEMTHANRIRTASQWYFESLALENESIKFILLTMVLEALLGEDQERNLITERIADRGAFLLSKNQLERSRIKEEFKKIYNTRSELVHCSTNRLPAERLKLYNKLQENAKRLLLKEAENFTG